MERFINIKVTVGSMEREKNKASKAKYVVPEDTDPIELAAEMKKGMGEEVLEDYRKLRKAAAKLSI